MNKEGWVIFRGKLMQADGPAPEIPDMETIEDLPEVVEIVKGDLISKSYIKLKESPLFHPNISYGDILKVKPSEEALSDGATILEFSGLESSDDELDINGLGSEQISFSKLFLDDRKKVESKVRPVIRNKFDEGLVFEPEKVISHGSYKINISYEASDEDLNEMKSYFKEWGVHFQRSSAPNVGSVAFNLETKFKKAVECLEAARWVKGCYLAFFPSDFPQIDFSPDLIPKGDNN